MPAKHTDCDFNCDQTHTGKISVWSVSGPFPGSFKTLNYILTCSLWMFLDTHSKSVNVQTVTESYIDLTSRQLASRSIHVFLSWRKESGSFLQEGSYL